MIKKAVLTNSLGFQYIRKSSKAFKPPESGAWPAPKSTDPLNLAFHPGAGSLGFRQVFRRRGDSEIFGITR